ncbi:phosphoenolpyruvate--protein phosphotransferase [Legionella longbeachae]|uniref:phosphoenolpyruvate--protein phosphotransferase n=1 Tax=Legionella longbeachae serogroup 1 (strain NSW150) TaxID=661367 RepID=D3HNQ1_LEGLN|nr:phosphoenolpyruvate--protein phosphotransferase [Legionella longbeachae]VEE01040.1 phosphoenolpyruvate-protein phosphotransferase PtsP [Legionella oakridgensis]HBD7398518.1 phosphoenolpyruvate--protein phosphotransferase [Legionella pneumophila]ARB92579.1 phosphoenolpyruvate-protein phosphotransferase PtsP [Legionella longbeachae]ARM34245.1 phosphoenolpyruvate--protein phosphotransferase [Legionella longbeachae]EEZ96492.1 phosphoenolpyruvate-protein phosphotransferase PtsP [Legionella longb
MLKVLKRIVQEVTAARQLSEALGVLVQQINKAINAEAASVYLIDTKHAEYVLIATEGLNKQAQFRVRISLDSGLVGLVGRREEPINIEDAPAHPDFYHNPLLGEEHLKAFLGVPIIQHRKIYGVLIVQQAEQRHFDDTEESFLITLAAQLGGIIAHAEATGELAELTLPKPMGVTKVEVSSAALTGIGSVPGIGIGTAVVVYPQADIDAVPLHPVETLDEEIKAFYEALESTREDMHRLSRRMKAVVAEDEHALFDVYLRILDKDSLGVEVEHVIRKEKIGAQAALATVIKKHIAQFESMEDSYLRERASDFRDLGRRVLAALQWSQQEEIVYPKRTILVGEEVTAAALAEVPEGYLAGVVSAKGSNNSHVAILARALGVPTVMGVRGLKLESLSKRAMVVDGYYGQVYISPSKSVLAEFKLLEQEEQALNQSLISLRDKSAETIDSYKVSLQVNTGLAMDAGLSMSVGAEGVGLYRSEVPFMSRDHFPSEDEQTIIYRQTLKAFAPRPVTMRTLDIGGDKVLPYFPVKEDNPYLGWRGIRVTLDHPDVFLMQVRAMMRASEELNNLRIMLPMVTNLSEVEEAAYLIEQAFTELLEEGCVIEKPKLGVMIEVPAAAYLAREIAKRVDFLSVGSNDLTQYFLAVDRNNARVAGLYDAMHPAMLRVLLKVVEGGHAAGVEVSICGEMASDPLAVILLIAMGFDTLSMNSSSLPRVKWVIRNFAIASARKILAEVLEFEHPAQIRFHLQKSLEEVGLGSLIRAGKSL